MNHLMMIWSLLDMLIMNNAVDAVFENMIVLQFTNVFFPFSSEISCLFCCEEFHSLLHSGDMFMSQKNLCIYPVVNILYVKIDNSSLLYCLLLIPVYYISSCFIYIFLYYGVLLYSITNGRVKRICLELEFAITSLKWSNSNLLYFLLEILHIEAALLTYLFNWQL